MERLDKVGIMFSEAAAAVPSVCSVYLFSGGGFAPLIENDLDEYLLTVVFFSLQSN